MCIVIKVSGRSRLKLAMARGRKDKAMLGAAAISRWPSFSALMPLAAFAIRSIPIND